MGRVYLVNSLHGDVQYTNTSREASRAFPDGYESLSMLDGAAECNRLAAEVEEAEDRTRKLRLFLEDLVNITPGKVEDSDVWQRVLEFCEKNPLPPATAADRDGERSYGGG